MNTCVNLIIRIGWLRLLVRYAMQRCGIHHGSWERSNIVDMFQAWYVFVADFLSYKSEGR